MGVEEPSLELLLLVPVLCSKKSWILIFDFSWEGGGEVQNKGKDQWHIYCTSGQRAAWKSCRNFKRQRGQFSKHVPQRPTIFQWAEWPNTAVELLGLLETIKGQATCADFTLHQLILRGLKSIAWPHHTTFRNVKSISCLPYLCIIKRIFTSVRLIKNLDPIHDRSWL